jgi:hypothetical protein
VIALMKFTTSRLRIAPPMDDPGKRLTLVEWVFDLRHRSPQQASIMDITTVYNLNFKSKSYDFFRMLRKKDDGFAGPTVRSRAFSLSRPAREGGRASLSRLIRPPFISICEWKRELFVSGTGS